MRGGSSLAERMLSESLRVVVVTDMSEVVASYAQLLAAHRHRLVGLMTSRKRNVRFADVVSNAPASGRADRRRHARDHHHP